jgi:CheY-like chemotaxis protein
MAADEQPSLILLEFQVAGRDGSDILRELKHDQRTRGIPVFMCTGGHMPSDRLLALELGADDYFEKPLDVDLLIERMVHQVRNGPSVMAGPSDTTRVPAPAIESATHCESCRRTTEIVSMVHSHTAQVAWVCSACRSALSSCWEDVTSAPRSSQMDRQQVEVLQADRQERRSQGKIRLTSEPAAQSILVVEDDNDIRRSVCDILEDEGFATLSARNGLEALELLRDQPTAPSVILLDLMMPVMDGWQFHLRLANDTTIPPIPVVVMSAYARDGRIASLQWLQKPIRLERLLSAIGEAKAG